MFNRDKTISLMRMISLDEFLKIWQFAFPLFFLSGLLLSGMTRAEVIQYDAGGRRDPVIPLVAKGGVIASGFNSSGLNIEGIIHDPKGGSVVLINGEYYREGQTVNKASVISIFKDRVLLAQGDEEKTLWLREELLPLKVENSDKMETANSAQ